MDFKLVSKNNIGVVATLLLVILLSQSRFLNFLIETPLGRAVLILFILGISYTNKILGVVSVLFVIILVSNSNMAVFAEGFTDDSKETTADKEMTEDKGTTEDNEMTEDNNTKAKEDKDIKMDKPKVPPKAKPVKKEKTVDDSDKPLGGREGFNIIDREGTMLRGKRSNEVPVFANARNQTDDVEPSDKSVFSGDFFHL
jgi:uncharacterized membrane protein